MPDRLPPLEAHYELLFAAHHPTNQLLIMIPSLTTWRGCGRLKEAFGSALCGSGAHVVAWDPIGCEHSAWSHTGVWEMGTLAEQVEALAATVTSLQRDGVPGADRPIVLGYQSGAGVALAFADRFPRSVTKLILIDGPAADQSLEQLIREPASHLWGIPTLLLWVEQEACLSRDRRQALINALLPDAPHRQEGLLGIWAARVPTTGYQLLDPIERWQSLVRILEFLALPEDALTWTGIKASR